MRNITNWGVSFFVFLQLSSFFFLFFSPKLEGVCPDHNDLRWHHAKSFPIVSEVTWQYITQWSKSYHRCDLTEPKKNVWAFILEIFLTFSLLLDKSRILWSSTFIHCYPENSRMTKYSLEFFHNPNRQRYRNILCRHFDIQDFHNRI